MKDGICKYIIVVYTQKQDPVLKAKTLTSSTHYGKTGYFLLKTFFSLCFHVYSKCCCMCVCLYVFYLILMLKKYI